MPPAAPPRRHVAHASTLPRACGCSRCKETAAGGRRGSISISTAACAQSQQGQQKLRRAGGRAKTCTHGTHAGGQENLETEAGARLTRPGPGSTALRGYGSQTRPGCTTSAAPATASSTPCLASKLLALLKCNWIKAHANQPNTDTCTPCSAVYSRWGRSAARQAELEAPGRACPSEECPAGGCDGGTI
eukprot:304951-Chlamydomonas_euryale.AAC.1